MDGLVRSFSGGERRLPFVLDRGIVVERRVHAARVVEALDELEDREPRLDLRLEAPPVEQAEQRAEAEQAQAQAMQEQELAAKVAQ